MHDETPEAWFQKTPLNAVMLSLQDEPPSSEFINSPKVPKVLCVSVPPIFLYTFYVDGIRITNDSITFNMKAKSVLHSSWKPDHRCLNVKLDTGTWQFVTLENHFNSNEIFQIADWIKDKNRSLLAIGTEFELHERQIYHFLYEILAMFHACKRISSDNQEKILEDTKTATDLYHNRILAEVLSGYSQKGATVELYQSKNIRKPDLCIGNTMVEIKTILLTGTDRKLLMRRLAQKLRNEIIDRENEKQQVGEHGSFFIGIWSGIINSILYTAYNNHIISEYCNSDVTLHKTLPPLNGKKAIFVIPMLNAFENQYMVFDRNKICDIVDYLAGMGYEKIHEERSMNYLALNNIKRGCEFGVTSDRPILIFKLR